MSYKETREIFQNFSLSNYSHFISPPVQGKYFELLEIEDDSLLGKIKATSRVIRETSAILFWCFLMLTLNRSFPRG